MAAPLGDDVLGDDPTVKSLEERCAAMFGMEAACFTPSGTMANQLAIRSWCDHGDEIIAHEDSHIIHYETGAPAAISGCMIKTLHGPRGQFTPEDVRRAIRLHDEHEPISRLLILENTHNRGGGSVWPLEKFRATAAMGRHCNLKVHLDGARLMNACTALSVEPTVFTQHVDSVSMCFSKGLGTPAGSILSGSESFVKRARRFRKMFGGTMRQTGLLAGAAIYALDHHVARLADDHRNAKRLAEGIARIPLLTIKTEEVETNMVFFHVDPSLGTADDFCQRLGEQGVLAFSMGPGRVRMVTHLDVSATMIDDAIRIIGDVVGRIRGSVLEGIIG